MIDMPSGYDWYDGAETGGRTPAEAAGVEMRGRDKRPMPARNAAAAAWRDGGARHRVGIVLNQAANPRSNPAAGDDCARFRRIIVPRRAPFQTAVSPPACGPAASRP